MGTAVSGFHRFTTTKGFVYLKQTPPSTTFSLEPKITQLLAKTFHAAVPEVVAANDALHCFLMEDAGESFRGFFREYISSN